MIVHAKPSAARQTSKYQYAIRFVLGGLSTVFAGLMAREWGPVVGGLFLAMPAIFCASATLIEKHERERKAKLGLRGERRGRQAAALDAAGTTAGSVALLAFALLAWQSLPRLSGWSLGLAVVAWLAVAILVWWLWRRPAHR
jgi:uncharacterized membrane protein YjfL (UPF0719 family)